MTLDDLATRFKKEFDDPIVGKLGDLLLAWKKNDATAEELDKQVERFFGTTWIDDEAVFNEVLHTWRQFRAEAIDPISGMTMNERLYHFGLFDRFDDSASDTERAALYRKLHAQP